MVKKVTTASGYKVYVLNDEEKKALDIIRTSKNLGLPPNVIYKELKEANISPSAMKAASETYAYMKKHGPPPPGALSVARSPAILRTDDEEDERLRKIRSEGAERRWRSGW